jgi:hypothetical protein
MTQFGETGFRATTGEKVAIGTMVVGGLAILAGALFYGRAAKKRTTMLRGTLGRVEARTKRGGMTMTHHYDPEMPIEQRVKLLQDLVWRGVQNPEMRDLALAITGNGTREVTVGKRKFMVQGAGCPARDGACETEAIYKWVKAQVRYTGDVAPVMMPSGEVEGVDLFQTGLRTAQMGGGDCDDHSVLGATLLSLNGIPAKFRITAPSKSADWAHIYPLSGLPKTRPTKWVALDTTLPGEMFGREAPYGKARDFVA